MTWMVPALMALCVMAPAGDTENLWKQGNEAYAQGDFEEAVTLYEALVSQGESAWGQYNLGNAYFRTGQLGKAVLAYKRAEARLPRSKEVKENLAQALKAADVEEATQVTVPMAFRSALSYLTLEEWLMAFSALYVLGIALGIVGLFSGK